jgi:PREDICTED: USO1 homolog, vesicle docking protein-like
MESELSSLETKINITDENEDEVSILKNDKKVLLEKVETLEGQIAKALNDLDNTKKEQDDLLILLTDQDSKIREYKKKLSELGHKVEDDYEDDIETGLSENFD